MGLEALPFRCEIDPAMPEGWLEICLADGRVDLVSIESPEFEARVYGIPADASVRVGEALGVVLRALLSGTGGGNHPN